MLSADVAEKLASAMGPGRLMPMSRSFAQGAAVEMRRRWTIAEVPARHPEVVSTPDAPQQRARQLWSEGRSIRRHTSERDCSKSHGGGGQGPMASFRGPSVALAGPSPVRSPPGARACRCELLPESLCGSGMRGPEPSQHAALVGGSVGSSIGRVLGKVSVASWSRGHCGGRPRTTVAGQTCGSGALAEL